MTAAPPARAVQSPVPGAVAPAAPTTRKIGPSASGPLLGAHRARFFRIPEERLASILRPPALPCFTAILLAAGADAKNMAEMASVRGAVQPEVRALVERMLDTAGTANWSGRELARRLSVPWTTWRRLANGSASLTVMISWLPRLREAANRLAGSAPLNHQLLPAA